jgi:hypothetical protein
MNGLAVSRQRNSAGTLHRLAHIIAIDLSRTRTERDAAAAVESANMRTTDANCRTLNRHAGRSLCLFRRALDRCGGFIKLDDDALA